MTKQQIIDKRTDIQKWKTTSLVEKKLIGRMLNDVYTIDTDFYFEKGYNQRRLDGYKYDKDIGTEKVRHQTFYIGDTEITGYNMTIRKHINTKEEKKKKKKIFTSPNQP